MAHSQIGRVAHVPPSSELIQYRGDLSPISYQGLALSASILVALSSRRKRGFDTSLYTIALTYIC
jgi:hypothetical protein